MVPIVLVCTDCTYLEYFCNEGTLAWPQKHLKHKGIYYVHTHTHTYVCTVHVANIHTMDSSKQ